MIECIVADIAVILKTMPTKELVKGLAEKVIADADISKLLWF